MNRKNIVVFISGRGSNMEALLDATLCPGYPARIVAVFSDRFQASGLEKAKSKNIPVHVIERKSFLSKKHHEDAILHLLAGYNADILCLAGYLSLISSHLIIPYQGRILNIHPSLLPLFPGLNPHQRVIESGMKITGCTVHLVTEEIDKGPIVAQAAVPIFQGDDKENLSLRVLRAEHCLYPRALEKFIKRERIQTDENQMLLA
ncbi:MAG: phosphoribosylglycinamide formyltransferase 1 [Candidatus Tokpelaia sp. JSC161]|jgi:formyltetrahydrofolate-dependent phosphoribosylglycinamide formyltransferase|nr:MAG: phosphoribosylglycinamide formyltransferase 1 [Candidatus Tokpelaia sp. JSC161]